MKTHREQVRGICGNCSFLVSVSITYFIHMGADPQLVAISMTPLNPMLLYCAVLTDDLAHKDYALLK